MEKLGVIFLAWNKKHFTCVQLYKISLGFYLKKTKASAWSPQEKNKQTTKKKPQQLKFQKIWESGQFCLLFEVCLSCWFFVFWVFFIFFLWGIFDFILFFSSFYFYQLAVGCSQLSKLAALNIILSHIILPLNCRQWKPRK